jgi:uncharacterized protein YabN with tetrapyrrole methylase and pyrophosphatase domain
VNIFEQIIAHENDAVQFGFKWENAEQIHAQLQSELAEIDVHLKDKDQLKLQEEIGDLLHAAFSLTLFCGFDPETTLTNSINKFAKRFALVKKIAAERGIYTLNGKPFHELMSIWDAAKNSRD